MKTLDHSTHLFIVAALAWLAPTRQLQAATLGEALDAPQLTWTTGGDAPWFVQTTDKHDGVAAAQSGPIGDNQKSWLRTTVTGPGLMTFWLASETANGDIFWIRAAGSGSGYSAWSRDNWQYQEIEIPAGDYEVEWSYEKDGSGSAGADAAWLDQVTWAPAAVPQIALASQWKYPGETCAFTATVAGIGPFTFQWYRDGALLPGATTTNLAPFTATYDNAGTYSLVASNLIGVATNDALLTVAPVFYDFTDLGALWPGSFTMYANGVNNYGVVVGHCATNVSGLGHAWVWSDGALTDLGDALGGGDSQAYAINDQGDIVGTARVAGTTNYNAVRWRNVGGSYVVDDLGRNGWPFAFAHAINNAGDIAFSVTDGGKNGSGNRRAWLWRSGNFLPLGDLTPAWAGDIGDAYGWGLNSVGQMAGTANAAPLAPGENPLKRGWVFNGGWRDNSHDRFQLGALPVSGYTIDSSGAYCVNDYGDLAGHYMHSFFGATGCFVTSGTNVFVLSDWFTYLEGLNNHGDVLGYLDSQALICSTNAAAPARLADGRPDYSRHRPFRLVDLAYGGIGGFASLEAGNWGFSQLSEGRMIVGHGTTGTGLSHAYLARPRMQPGNHAPVQNAPLIVTNFANTLIIPIADLLASCADVDGDALALVAADGRSSDGSTIRRSGNYLFYAPPPGSYSDPDAFAGTVMDFHGGQTPVTVIVRNRPSGPLVLPDHLGMFNDPTGRPRLRFSATPGTLWRLEASDSLGAGGWTTLLTFVVGPDWRVDFGDPASLAQARKFYRAVSP